MNDTTMDVSMIVPQGDQVLVRIHEDAEMTTKAGIIIKQEDKKADWHGVHGTVLAIGNKVVNRSIIVGAHVIFNRYDGIDFRHEVGELRLLKAELIFAVVR